MRIGRQREHDGDAEVLGHRLGRQGAHVGHPQVQDVDRSEGQQNPSDAPHRRDPCRPRLGGAHRRVREGNRSEDVPVVRRAEDVRRRLGRARERVSTRAMVESAAKASPRRTSSVATPPLSPVPALVSARSRSAWRNSWATVRPRRSAIVVGTAVRPRSTAARRATAVRASSVLARARTEVGRGSVADAVAERSHRGEPHLGILGEVGGTVAHRPGCSTLPGTRPSVSTRRARAAGSWCAASAPSRARATWSAAEPDQRSRVRWASMPGKPPAATTATRRPTASSRGRRAPRPHAACSRRNACRGTAARTTRRRRCRRTHARAHGQPRSL